MGLRGRSMSAGRRYPVAGRFAMSARRTVPLSLRFFTMAGGSTVFAFRLCDDRFDAIGVVGQPRGEHLGVLERQVDAHSIIFAVRIRLAIEVVG